MALSWPWRRRGQGLSRRLTTNPSGLTPFHNYENPPSLHPGSAAGSSARLAAPAPLSPRIGIGMPATTPCGKQGDRAEKIGHRVVGTGIALGEERRPITGGRAIRRPDWLTLFRSAGGSP